VSATPFSRVIFSYLLGRARGKSVPAPNAPKKGEDNQSGEDNQDRHALWAEINLMLVLSSVAASVAQQCPLSSVLFRTPDAGFSGFRLGS
jgi:hypothetical protein